MSWMTVLNIHIVKWDPFYLSPITNDLSSVSEKASSGAVKRVQISCALGWELDQCADELDPCVCFSPPHTDICLCLHPSKYLRAGAVPDTSIKTHHCFKPVLLWGLSSSHPVVSWILIVMHLRTCTCPTWPCQQLAWEAGDVNQCFHYHAGSWTVAAMKEVPCILLPLLSSVNSCRKLWQTNFQPSQQDFTARPAKTLILLLICHLLPLKQNKGLSKLKRIC